MEASDSLGLEEVNGPAWAELDSHVAKQRSLKKEIESLQESKATYGDVMGDVDDQLEKWEAIKDDFENGETVFAPLTKKRKRMNGEEGQSRKKRNRQEDQDDGFTASDSDESVDGGKTEGNYNAEEDEDRAPLTEEQITAKIFDLRTMKKEARRQRVDLENKIKETKKQVAAAKDQEQKIEANISKVCIEGRNAYSKGAIQLDFAAGMKELDQEIAAEDDEEAFNPDVDIRDYDEVARSLPVFCVSSRGYQKLQGRLTKDPPVPGFTTLEQTEIPQLQAHCKSLTVAGRTANCKRFMTNLSQLLNSMIFWVSSDGTNVHLTANQKENAARFLQKSLEDLEIVSNPQVYDSTFLASTFHFSMFLLSVSN
jgi:predicted  nucleic acid-binding Zn-ribbon protein